MNKAALERAYEHVAANWIPPHPDVLARVRERCSSGYYNFNREDLRKDLTSDYALFMYCLRELALMAESKSGFGGDVEVSGKTPPEIFESADLEVIEEIFCGADSRISNHSLREMNDLQALRFRESMLSASTAEVLAENAELSPDLGFSCACLRQLGLTLIAWNYPRVYAKALDGLSGDDSLDSALQRTLGFSPSLLGLRFAREWNLSTEVLVALGDTKPRSKSSIPGDEVSEIEEKMVGETLSKLCRVGEALARANDPEHYPTALSDWEEAEEAIQQHLGPKGLSLVLARAKDYCEEYVKSAPKFGKLPTEAPKREAIVSSRHSRLKLAKNTAIKDCPKDVREMFEKLYSNMDPEKIVQENLRYLIHELVPAAGFSSCAVYMLDPVRQVLNPVLKRGEIPKSRLRAIGVTGAMAQLDLVASAFSCKAPLREQRSEDDGSRAVVLSAALGSFAPSGVLYLETYEETYVEGEVDPMPIFRAIREALTDSLNLD